MIISPLNISPLSNKDLGAESFTNTRSVLMDGVDEFINIDSVLTSLAATTVGTIALWVKPVDATPVASELPVAFGDASASEYIFLENRTDGKFRVTNNIAGSVKWAVSTSGAVFTNNVWVHIAIVQDGVQPVLYVDGVAVAQTNITSLDLTTWFAASVGLDNGRLGALKFNGSAEAFHYNGNIDEPLFINRALSAAQILDIYNSGAPKDETGIANGVSQFRIDGDIIPTCTDAIGSNNGTYVNIEQIDLELDVP